VGPVQNREKHPARAQIPHRGLCFLNEVEETQWGSAGVVTTTTRKGKIKIGNQKLDCCKTHGDQEKPNSQKSGGGAGPPAGGKNRKAQRVQGQQKTIASKIIQAEVHWDRWENHKKRAKRPSSNGEKEGGGEINTRKYKNQPQKKWHGGSGYLNMQMSRARGPRKARLNGRPYGTSIPPRWQLEWPHPLRVSPSNRKGKSGVTATLRVHNK